MNDYVKLTQKTLFELGHQIEIDGIYGSKTSSVLMESIESGSVFLIPSEYAEFKEEISKPKESTIDRVVDDILDRPVGKNIATPSTGMTLIQGISHYCQADLRWANRIMGNKRTFRKAGCAVTCCAMWFDYLTEREILPARPDKDDPDPTRHLDVFLDQNGGYQGDSLIWSTASTFDKNTNLVYNRHTLEVGEEALSDMARKELDAGRLAMLRIRYNKDNWGLKFNHFVLAVGYKDDGTIIFHDPGHISGNAYQEDVENSMKTTRKGGYQLVGLELFKQRGVV